MLRLPELIPFARKHGLTIISIEDLIAYRRRAEPHGPPRGRAPGCPPPTATFTAYGYRSTVDGVEHIALVARRRSATARTSWSGSTPSA